MANIKYPKKEFEKTFGKLTEEMKEQISMFGTHFEGEDNESIEVQINPNRPDLYSMKVFTKDFLAFLGKSKPGLRVYPVSKPEKNFEVKIDKSVKEVRPYTACAIIKNLKFNDENIKEMIDIQEKIHMTLGRNRKKIAIGIYPLEKITLPIKFEARAPKDIKFIPLEMDRELNGLQILQSHKTGREYAHLLEGKEKFPVFVDSKSEILSMPPIINSHKTGKVSENTNSIFIECSGFDYSILKKTLNILSVMFAEMGGKICQMELDYDGKKVITPNLEPEKIKLSTEAVNKLIGLNLKETEIKTLLEKMGYNYDIKTRTAEIPAWRTDIMHEVDLIEDIAIAYGYNNLIPEIPSIATAGEIAKIEVLKKKISDILVGQNMLELSTYHLLTKDDAKALVPIQESIIEVEDSKSEYKILKSDLLISNLKILSQNVDSEYPQRVFELGRVFNKDKEKETGIAESDRLCISIASPTTGFTEIKQILDYVMRMLGKGKNYTIENATNPFFIEGRCGKILINSKPIGFLGEIQPSLINKLGIKMPISALEIDVEELI